MAINRPTTKTIISTAGWGIPITDQVNLNASDIAALKTAPWINASYLNGWTTFTGYQPAAYRKIGDMVQVRGIIALGSMNAVAFILPTGYRPPMDLILPQRCSGNTSGTLIIRANGDYLPQVGVNTWFTITATFSITP